MSKRIFALMLALCLLMTATVVSVQAATGDKVKLRMVYWNKEETMKHFLDLVKEKLPHIDLDYQFIPVDQMDGIINTQLQAGEGPDILHNGSNIPAVKAGYLLALDD